jgi:hypothetical protein
MKISIGWSPTFPRLSPGWAVLVLGMLTALTLYTGLFLIDFTIQFVLHWGNPFQNGTVVDSIAGALAVALLNMLLWWLFVVIPGSVTLESATLTGIVCGAVGPTVMAFANLLFELLVRGYFLNYQGLPSTDWQEISWPLTMWPIAYTVLFCWLTLLACILLDRWMVGRVRMKH